jgi:hypothetical protein
MKFYVVEATPHGKIEHYVSFIPPDKAFKVGLDGRGVIGILKNGKDIVPENFIPNRVFQAFMHSIIAREIHNESSCKKQAKKIKEGYVYIIDKRTKNPQGDIPPYDIFGFVKVSNGKLVKGVYTPNPNHALVSDDGIFQLPKQIEKKILDEVNKLLKKKMKK